MTRRIAVAALGLTVLGGACGGDSGGGVADASTTQAPALDAATGPDAAADPDAAVGPDASPPPPDAAPSPDALADAPPPSPDAAPSPDARAPDAAPPTVARAGNVVGTGIQHVRHALGRLVLHGELPPCKPIVFRQGKRSFHADAVRGQKGPRRF
jgi:hypothetical protein